MAERRRSPQEIAESMAAAKKLKAKEVLAEQRKRIRNARYALLILGILQCGVAFWEVYFMRMNYLGLLIDGGIGLAFIGLFFYSAQNPKASFITGLCIYLAIQVLLFILFPPSVFNGIILKLIVVSVLFGGLNALKRIPESLLRKKDSEDLLDTPEKIQDLE